MRVRSLLGLRRASTKRFLLGRGGKPGVCSAPRSCTPGYPDSWLRQPPQWVASTLQWSTPAPTIGCINPTMVYASPHNGLYQPYNDLRQPPQ